MVVASGGWMQNASYSTTQNNSNMNTTVAQNNNMEAKAVLICRDNSHPFQERTLILDQPVKIGRSVARARAAQDNAIFDCKVLSRNHALLWYNAGKFYLKDTKSSNGTFVNNQRLSLSGDESSDREVCSGDIVQFGVDVVENTKKVTHGCIVATLRLYLPDGKEAKASPSTSVAGIVGNISLEDLYKLNQCMREAHRREKALNNKLDYLQQLVQRARWATDQSWKALIDEDRLLSRVKTVESQLAAYSKVFTKDKIRNELAKLEEEKGQYQVAAKEALQKILQEKLEVKQSVAQLERQLNQTEEECQSLHEVTKQSQAELEELAKKYTEAQEKLQETRNQLVDNEEKAKEAIQKLEREKQDLLRRVEDQSMIERNLQARLRDSKLDSVNIHKQISALRNYMQTLQDMNAKLISDENSESKDEMKEAINVILNKLNSMPVDNFESDTVTFYASKTKQDNQLISQDNDSNQTKNVSSESTFVKRILDVSLADNDYILPPASRRTLVNGNANVDGVDISLETDANSEATDDTWSVASDDTSEKSVIEVKKDDDNSTPTKAPNPPAKLEVRFASDENGEQLEVHYDPIVGLCEDVDVPESTDDNVDSQRTDSQSISTVIATDQDNKFDEVSIGDEEESAEVEECEGEHLDGDYIKTLKPLSKSDSLQQSLHSREYVLQTLIGSLDSLSGDDDLEAQQLVKKELDELRDWLIRESNETVIGKLKELYYRAKNETQRIQEVNEELVILKEKCNVFVEEKSELVKKYESLKAQCGDLLSSTYTVPIQYVVPIVIALIWMLLEKMF
ncbi:sarcolemmal membrane-associated protein [Cephus cinctus]|uniref:Sarcolemmal membrane-associated protein n=1 Tax=Cephus cinctus TaxID=211228 RepID=A0AAJ7BR41_CEPCN|nr:sarcolemmal membrane-associated protein [Cephus cinctus]